MFHNPFDEVQSFLGHVAKEIHCKGDDLYIVRGEKEGVIVAFFASLFSFRRLANREADVKVGGVRRGREWSNDGHVKQELPSTDNKHNVCAMGTTFIARVVRVTFLTIRLPVAEVIADEGFLRDNVVVKSRTVGR